jgi:hypothetical protein
MTPCLSPAELIELADGVLSADRLAHVASCRGCRETAAEVATTLAEIAAVDVPEPSPYFWAALNHRVRAALADDAPAHRSTAWFGWRAVVPLAAIALVLIGLAATIERRSDAPALVVDAPLATPVESDVPVPAGDDALALLVALADTLPGADAAADALVLAPLPELGDVATVTLTADELQALETLLRQAAEEPES